MVDRLGELYVDRMPWYEAHQRHWCPCSERYAPAEVLVEYLHHGWELDDRVTVARVRFGTNRYSEIYHFALRRARCSVEMPVIANPVVLCIFRECPNLVLRYLEADPMRWSAYEDQEPYLVGSSTNIWSARFSQSDCSEDAETGRTQQDAGKEDGKRQSLFSLQKIARMA